MPPDRRIERPFGRELREVAAEVVERGRLGLFLALGRRRLGTRAAAGRRRGHLAPEQSQRLGARLLEVHACVRQDLCGNPLLLTQQPEQQMLGAHVGVIELPRLAHRQLEHLLGARCIGKVGTGRRRRFALLDRLLDLLLNLFQIDVEIGQHRRGDTLALADQTEQDVLGPDVLVMQTRRLFAGHLQNFPNAIREIVAVHLRRTHLSPFNWIPLRAGVARTPHAPSAARDRRGTGHPSPPGGQAECRSATC